MSIDITITEAARQHIQKMILKEKGIAFRLSIKKTGCSGYGYLPSVIDHIPLNETEVNQAGLKIVLDPAWLDLLQGLHIDLIQDNNMLKQKRLVFTNAKETARCGCGESFHVE